MLLAWSAGEGFLRLIGHRENIALEKRSSSYELKRLFSLGLLGRRTYEQLNKTMKARNSLVHGLKVPGLRADMVMKLTEEIRKNIRDL